MLFATFALRLQQLESTASRLQMTRLLADLYRELDAEDVCPASYLLQGSLVPSYQSLDFQLSVKMILRALARVVGSGSSSLTDSPKATQENLFSDLANSQDATAVSVVVEDDHDVSLVHVTKRYKELGDLGKLAEEIIALAETAHESRATSPPKLVAVHQILVAIAKVSGVGSQEQKLLLLIALLRDVDAVSAKFIVRCVLGKLRLGFSTMTMIDALSWLFVQDKSLSEILEEAYQKRADIGLLARTALSAATPEELQQKLAQYAVMVGVPVVPALCQRVATMDEVVEKMGNVLIEPKYDGLRIQIHYNKSKGQIAAYTRNLEEVTHMFPELAAVGDELLLDNCILDAEAIGFDPQTGKLKPFQETITRKRKHDISLQAESVPIRFYVFDVLAMNGVSLIDLPLLERKRVLANGVSPQATVIRVTEFMETSDPNKLREYHELQLSLGLEGAVMKQINSEYRGGRKGWRWVKMKESEGESGKLADTVDCVVMGYYVGKGKRTSFGMGAFLVGVLSDAIESTERAEGADADYRVVTLAKIGTGLTDEQFGELKERAKPLLASNKPKEYQLHKNLTPDGWLMPGLVVEIAADELTHSPIHSAGWALRFPRLVRFRDDKTWEQCTTLQEIRELATLKTEQH